MKRWNKINPLQYGIMIYFIINSTTLGICMNNYTKIGVDGYLVPIIGFIIGFIPLYIFIKILNYKPDLNIYEKIDYLFGKVGIIINIILSIIIYILIIIIYINLLDFIQTNYLFKTNPLFISIIFSISLIYACTKSINVIFRLGNILFYITSILFIISILGLLRELNFNNLLPILEHDIPINSISFHITYTIFPLFILLMIPKSNIDKNNQLNKYIYTFYIIASITKIIVVLFTISILGINLTQLYKFPEFLILRRISTTGFFQRFEGILGIQWIFTMFIMLSSCYLYIKNNYIHLFHKYKDIFVISLILITATLCI